MAQGASTVYRICLVGAGLSQCFVGVIALFRPGYYSRHYASYISFGAHHEIVGGILIAVGLAIAIVAWRSKKESIV